jgi:hypothetical protein
MSTSFRLKPEVKAYLEARQAEWHQDSLTDTLHKLVLDYKSLSEKAAEPAISPFSLNEPGKTETPRKLNAPEETGTQQPSHPIPQRRSFLTPSPTELAYMKEKARQKARTEAMLERAQQKEEFKKQATADREEQEYFLWKKRQDEKDRLTFRGPKVLYPGMG